MKQVILDTDIGCDIDDTWALCHLLNSPELNPKLITTVTGSTDYRTRLVAKMLLALNRTDIPVARGVETDMRPEQESLREWVKDFDWQQYPAPIGKDAVADMARIITQTKDITLICIGPLNNVEQLARRYPNLTKFVNVIAMAGSIRKQLQGKPGKIPEWNVKTQIKAAQKVFATTWKSFTITPLDTCGNVVLDPRHYDQVRKSSAITAQLVCQNYSVWRKHLKQTAPNQSSTLFDTVAIYLAYARNFLTFRNMFLSVDDQGLIQVNRPEGKPVMVALDWTDLDAYRNHLVRRIVNTRNEA